ncbi:MAG: hypothetical protein COC01_01160 [Bacteroidetes bacterium]|nr:hypothetical protein [Bacteroidia bacterium]PCH69607.1 MAG: hypothetical protein COC01_01160 [Bacteroidota bacterium]
MEWEQLFLEFVKIVLPSLVVFMAVYFVIKSFLENDAKKGFLNKRIATQEITLPLRLQAYERMTLFLERINPASLLIRAKGPRMTARKFHEELLSIIRTEFEHNLTQQIYLSNEVWVAIRSAKEDTVRIINTAAEGIADTAPATELSKKIFEVMMDRQEIPNQKALDVIRKEIQRFY